MRRLFVIALAGFLAAGTAAAQPYGPGPHELDRARRNLDQAIADAQRARGGFAGHRARAIDLMRRAQRELGEAARYER